MRVLIVGCGYTGLPLGRQLAEQGHEVFGLRRDAGAAGELKKRGIQLVTGDVTIPETLRELPGPFDWVVNLVSSSKGGVDEYRKVYLQGMMHLVEWLKAEPPRKFVFTSSTSVYGQTDGSQVKETSAAEPESETSKILLEAEKVLLAASHVRPVILRVAGIYGPGRGHLFQQYLKNEARIEGKGDRWINMIHVDDLAGVIMAALKDGRPGEIYNAVDDEPVAQIHFFRWLSETLGKWMPPFTEPSGEPRKRGMTHKKVMNRRLTMELGYRFKYPTFRQGYTAEIQRLDEAGELDIEPEVR